MKTVLSSLNVLNQKDEEIKELKYEIEQLKSENDMFKSMKTYIEEQNEKRASSVAMNHKVYVCVLTLKYDCYYLLLF
jgi:hypothetical protein